MNYQKNQKPVPELCVKCREMYGHESFSNMCSKCFKTEKKQKEDQLIEKLESLQQLQRQIRQKKSSNQNGNNLFTNSIRNIQLFEHRAKDIKKQEQADSDSQEKYGERSVHQDKSQRERTREKQVKKQINKCFKCSKKVGLLGYDCKHCVNNFCKFHRLPEDHECCVDFISAGKKLLAEANPEIKTRKISGIDH